MYRRRGEDFVYACRNLAGATPILEVGPEILGGEATRIEARKPEKPAEKEGSNLPLDKKI